jgi:ubiquinone/menaquinone biosynthesis C-methylase UbiE
MEKFDREPLVEGPVEERVFRSYMEDLRLTPEDFNKKILDVGAGSAQFAKWAKEHGVSDEIYSLDPMEEGLIGKEKSVVASAETIPFKSESFDLVVSDSAIPNIYLGEGSAEIVKEKVKSSLQEMVRVVKSGGEIRLAPVLIGNKYESQRILSQSIEEALKSLGTDGGIEIEKIKMSSGNIYEYENGLESTEIIAEPYLIILRKKVKTTAAK